MAGRSEMGQLKPVKCTYGHCSMRFDTEREMKYHKKNDPEHFYCKRCNVDCVDFEDLTQHKVDMMRPWLEKQTRPAGESPQHIVCEFCGKDFKSFGGRKLHREQEHQGDQSLTCPGEGCNFIFARAGHLVEHLEKGHCVAVSKRQFLSQIQRKHITKEIMNHPGELAANLIDNQQNLRDQGRIENGSKTQGEGAEAVGILDHEEEDQSHGIQPLEAEFDLLTVNGPMLLTEANLASWPALNGARSHRSHSSNGSSDAGVALLDPHLSMVPAAKRTAYTEHDKRMKPALSTRPRFMAGIDVGDASPPETPTGGKATVKVGAWRDEPSSQVLFQNKKVSASSQNWTDLLQTREPVDIVPPTKDLRSASFWDPASKDFDVRIFRNGVTGKYHCPFEGCEDAVYEMGIDMTGHLQHAHLRQRYTCPLCLKRFKNASALVSHSEAVGRCKVKKSTKYHALLDEVSGGFLTVEHLRLPTIAKTDDSDPTNGILSSRYEAQMPDDL